MALPIPLLAPVIITFMLKLLISFMPAYKHLFFDLDHTLWDFDTNARHTLTDIYAEFEMNKKVSAPFDDFYKQYLHHNEVLWKRYHNGFITADDLKWKR